MSNTHNKRNRKSSLIADDGCTAVEAVQLCMYVFSKDQTSSAPVRFCKFDSVCFGLS